LKAKLEASQAKRELKFKKIIVDQKKALESCQRELKNIKEAEDEF
jgi:hypothetical protein